MCEDNITVVDLFYVCWNRLRNTSSYDRLMISEYDSNVTNMNYIYVIIL